MYINMATLKPVNELQYKLCDATHRITETVDACRAPQYTVGRMSSAVQCDLRCTHAGLVDVPRSRPLGITLHRFQYTARVKNHRRSLAFG
jgi:hypothetical protein